MTRFQALPVDVKGQHTVRGEGILGKCLCNFEIYKRPEEREEKHRLR